MTDKERIDIMREGWEMSLKTNDSCRIFLEALLSHLWLGSQKAQIRDLLLSLNESLRHGEMYFPPEVINAGSE